MASTTVAAADTSSARPLPPVKTTCVTPASFEPRTRMALPGRAVVSEPQPVRHVTDEATAGTDAGATSEPPNSVPPLNADAGAAMVALSTAMTMMVRRFSSIHSPVDGPTGLADGLATSCRYQGVVLGFAPGQALPAQWFPRSGRPGGRADRIRQSSSGGHHIPTCGGKATTLCVPYSCDRRAEHRARVAFLTP